MIFNISKKKYICRNPLFANTFALRLRGMIGRKFNGFDAMVFENCNCIHTMFMTSRLDIIFVDGENTVCGLRDALPCWLPMVKCDKAAIVVELPPGAIANGNTEIGDVLNFSSETSTIFEQKPANKKIIPSAETIVSLKESQK